MLIDKCLREITRNDTYSADQRSDRDEDVARPHAGALSLGAPRRIYALDLLKL
jgi:hypothetical protein